MSTSKSPEPYEPPAVEEIDTDEGPATVSAAAGTGTISDERLKTEIRPLTRASG